MKKSFHINLKKFKQAVHARRLLLRWSLLTTPARLPKRTYVRLLPLTCKEQVTNLTGQHFKAGPGKVQTCFFEIATNEDPAKDHDVDQMDTKDPQGTELVDILSIRILQQPEREPSQNIYITLLCSIVCFMLV